MSTKKTSITKSAPRVGEKEMVGPTAAAVSEKPIMMNRKERKKAIWLKRKLLPRKESEKQERRESCWAELPDLILERIFSYLSIRDRFYASQTCKRWYEAFYLPYVWSNFTLGDSTLVRRKFNYYMGWQYVLDHMRTQNCLATVGRNIRTLVFEPMLNFFNLYEFMTMLSYYAERNVVEKTGKVVYHKGNIIPILVDVRGGGMGIGSRISTLRFTFPCNMAQTAKAEDESLFGTGGRLLESFKRLMGSLGPTLRHLQLVDLLLERYEALKLLDEVCYYSCETLQTLKLINVTKVPCQLIHPGVFIRLEVLVLSPQTLGPELLQLLGQVTTLRHLHLLQNRYTPDYHMSAPWKCWRQCRLENPHLNVHLEAENTRTGEVVWQQCAPVRSILYRSPYIKVSSSSVLTAIDQYRSDLEVYGHSGIPRFERSKSFHDRADSLLLLLCRQCPNLHTLVVRERVSTATVLLLAWTGHNLRYLHVRRNAVILRCDWPRSPEWSEIFYKWLQTAARSYEATEREVSQILGYKWNMLTDRQFKLMNINVRVSPYDRQLTSRSAGSFHSYVPPPLPTPTADLLPDVRERKQVKKIRKVQQAPVKNGQ